MWLTLLAFACTSTPPAAPPAVQLTPEAPPAPMAPPTGRAVVTTVRPVSYAGEAWSTAVQRSTEEARQRAHRCHAENPAYKGDLDVTILVSDQGRVREVRTEPSAPLVVTCLKSAIAAVRFPVPSGQFPELSVRVQWHFDTAPIDLEHDCVEDSECGLVTGVCNAPSAVNRREADRVEDQNQKLLSVARCADTFERPALARCVEGSCASVPADMEDLRGCATDAECAVIERWCGWDTVAMKRADEARDIVRPVLDAIPCDGPRGTPPVARCKYQYCTLDWAGK